LDDDDEPIEATRAIRLDDFQAAQAAQSAAKSPASAAPKSPVAAPRPMPKPMPAVPGSAPQGPRPVTKAPAPMPLPPQDEEDQSTRMFEAIETEAATRAIDTSALAAMRPQGKAATPMELRTVSGPDRGKIHRVPEGKHLVGRGLDCNIVLADPAVSRKHFQIERTDDEAVLSDLGGANGTSINGVKKPRHVLESGDRIEIGTSVLEFYIEGAEPVGRNRQAMPERNAAATPQVQYERNKTRKRLLVRFGAIFAIVAVGGGVGAYFATRKSAPTAKPAAAAPVQEDGAAEVTAAIAQAKKLLSETPPDFANALDILKAAKKKDAANKESNKELKGLIASTRKEVEAEDTFEEAKQALKAGDFQGAIAKFGDVDKDTQKYADAQDELAAATESLFSQRMTDAKKANEAGDTAAAIKALDAILAVDANRAEAKAMRAQLVPESGDAKAAPEAKPTAEGKVAGAEKKPADEKKPVEEKPAVAAHVPAEKAEKVDKVRAEHAVKLEPKAPLEKAVVIKAEPTPPGKTEPGKLGKPVRPEPAKVEAPKQEAGKAEPGKKADFSAGLTAYHNRLWTPAVQAFDAIATGANSKDQKAKGAAYAAAVRQVEASLNDAQAAGTNARKAIAAYKQAYNADKRVDGTHGGFIAGKLADGYLGLAKANLAAEKYADAFEDAQESLNYQPDKAEANQIVDKCVQQAATMLKKAKDLMDKKNYLGARDLARTVAHILPASDARQAEAQEIAKKATELSRQDAD
jgi:pSer/pThr/pTyr-binding forkhead associated (FHA) protein